MDAERIVTRGVIVIAGAAAAALVWALAGMSGGIQTSVSGASGDMPLWQVLTAAAVAGAAGWGLLLLLEWRVPRRARRMWTTTAVIVAALSLAGPIAVPGIDLDDRVWLAVMHAAVALAYIPAMSRTAAAKRT